MKVLCLLTLPVLMLLFCGYVQAVTILADTTGEDAFVTREFWGVSFLEGNGYVKSVTFDLSTTSRVLMFDFNGPNTTYPILTSDVGIGHFEYITSDDYTPGEPRKLTFLFLPGLFGIGDSFRFYADYDGYHSDGAAIGEFGATFRVEMYDGKTGSAQFVKTSEIRSEAIVHPSHGVPEPSTILLLGAGLAGLVGLRRLRG